MASPPSSPQLCHRPSIDVLSNCSLVPISLIDDAPGSPREHLPDVDELAANIRTFGLLQPLALRRVDGRYQVLSGHRRLAAYRLLRERHPTDPQWTAILAAVTRTDDETAHLSMISGQVHILGWTDAEVHQVLLKLRTTGMNQSEIARAIHRTEAWVSRHVRVFADPVIALSRGSGRIGGERRG